jgi:FkbM family methyltransferase
VIAREVKASAKKGIRTALFFAPSLYRFVTSEWRYLGLYRLGRVHEPEFRLIAPLLPESPTVLDIGGNIGQSLLSVLVAVPDAHVVSFEPNPGPAATLRKVAARFPGQAEVEPFGLGEVATTNVLYVPTYRGKEMPGLASFDEAEAHDWINPKTVFLFDEDHLSVEAFPAETKCLDDLGYDPHFIKIDVQGFEYEVIKGGLETVERCQPIIMAEAPTPDLVELLTGRGYSVVEHNGVALRPTEGRRANQIFLPARLSLTP